MQSRAREPMDAICSICRSCFSHMQSYVHVYAGICRARLPTRRTAAQSTPVHQPLGRKGAYTCIYLHIALHIAKTACAYSAYTPCRLPGPALSELEKTDAIRGDPLEWVLESVLFLINLNDRAICTICAAHVLHIALFI